MRYQASSHNENEFSDAISNATHSDLLTPLKGVKVKRKTLSIADPRTDHLIRDIEGNTCELRKIANALLSSRQEWANKNRAGRKYSSHNQPLNSTHIRNR